MISIKIIYMRQYVEVRGDLVAPLPFPWSRIMKRIVSGQWTDPVYTFSFGVVESEDGTTLYTLLENLPGYPDSVEVHCIRGNKAVSTSKDDGRDFLLCDGDIIHITDKFSLAKRFFGDSYIPVIH